ncbi:MAG: hypothetical protein M1819_006981 [Sarea resinae]|nr:MAG: hypothetical protein M1819_006981 [Sarea resinae]
MVPASMAGDNAPPTSLSPFSTSTSTSTTPPGHGTIFVSILPPSRPSIRTLNFTYPLKLISPDPITLPNERTVLLIFLLTYGGGLVAGDSITLGITLAPETRLSLVTQGSTKIFKSPRRDLISRQTLDVAIGRGAALCYLPDPTQPFAQSCYEQRQIFGVAHDASLCALDWVSEGRRARGEKWDFWSWAGKNEVWTLAGDDNGGDGDGDGLGYSRKRLLLRDNIVLDSQAEGFSETLSARMDGLGIFGTLILRGPIFERLGRYFLDEFSQMPRIGGRNWSSDAEQQRQQQQQKSSPAETKRAARLRREKEDRVLWTAAAVRGVTLVKFGASEVEGARSWLGGMLREEGTVLEEFGEGALLCLR